MNLFFPAGAEKKYLHKVHYNAWKEGCKGLYYLRTETGQRAENVSEKVERNALKDYESQAVCDITAQSQDECKNVSRLELTDSAREYLLKVGKPNVSLSVKGGGCSGFQYEWGLLIKNQPLVTFG